MVCESIPGAVLQLYAIILSSEFELIPLISLFASALSVGAISSKMSYYMDISVRNREKSGNFYGYVPKSKRSQIIIQVTLLTMASSQLLTRSLSYALIAISVGASYAIFAVGVEAGVFLLYKLAMSDFYYNLNWTGAVRLIGSFMLR
jgi:hypothetical protein